MKKLLLHSCCADCTLKFINSLKQCAFDVTAFYYNPNIHPRSEYLARLQAIQTVCSDLKVKLIIPNWRPKEYFEQVKAKQNKARCHQCWQLRLKATADYAQKQGFTVLSTTLLSSKYQDKNYLIKLGQKTASGVNLNFYAPEQIRQECKTNGFYRQNYCGCCYSLVERMEEKFLAG